jgi:hypothetical protein
MKKYLIVTCCTLLILAACQTQQEENTAEAPRVSFAGENPRGDSELALLMRSMFEETQKMKKALRKGEKPPLPQGLEAIHTASGTEPEKVGSDTYKQWSEVYLTAAKAYQEAPLEKAPQAYTLMVEQCKSCHQELCPGPLMRIEKLEL